MGSSTSITSDAKKVVESDTAAKANSSKIEIETGWPLWKMFLSLLGMVALGTIVGDLIRGRVPQIGTATLWLWAATPIVVGLSAILHEYIHAYSAKHLMGAENIRINFTLLGGETHASINQDKALWRHLIYNVSPSVICTTLGIVGMLSTIIVSVFLPDSWNDALNGIAVAMLMSAGTNLFNLLPIGPLDGGHARREIMSSWREYRRARKSVAVLAA